MALSLKNTLVSLSLSGALLFTGYLAGDEPADAAEHAFGEAAVQADVSPRAQDAKAGAAPGKFKRAFAAPYFSFGKPGFTQGAKQ